MMRVTDLIGHEVFGADGTTLGKVHDVRLVRQARYGAAGALRLDGLVIGKGGAAVRLGYASDDVTGPWLLKAVLGRVARRARYVPWTDVQLVDGRIVVRADHASLRRPREV
jgi:sporulation protein YlmC with PRC-barrel domain